MVDGYPTLNPMDKRFLNAFLTPKSTILLGKRLLPWCLKHRIQLSALENPLAIGGEVRPFDLLVFARVCSEERFRIEPTFGERWRLRSLGTVSGLTDAIVEAKAHMKQDDWPRFWEKSESVSAGDRMHGIPWALSVIANLVRHGVSHDEALHLPEAYAIWLSTALGVHEGAKVDILTTDQEEMLDGLAGVGNDPQT